MSWIMVYTIGHSNLDMNTFLSLLSQFNIEQVADVRSAPYSRFFPHFNQKNLQNVLTSQEILYVYLGDSLGGRPQDPSCYRIVDAAKGKNALDYRLISAKSWFQSGIDRLVEISKEKITAILCSEEDPSRCHRQHIIAQALLHRDLKVKHIRKDGSSQAAWFE